MASDMFFMYGLVCFVVGFGVGKFFDKIADAIQDKKYFCQTCKKLQK